MVGPGGVAVFPRLASPQDLKASGNTENKEHD